MLNVFGFFQKCSLQTNKILSYLIFTWHASLHILYQRSYSLNNYNCISIEKIHASKKSHLQIHNNSHKLLHLQYTFSYDLIGVKSNSTQTHHFYLFELIWVFHEFRLLCDELVSRPGCIRTLPRDPLWPWTGRNVLLKIHTIHSVAKNVIAVWSSPRSLTHHHTFAVWLCQSLDILNLVLILIKYLLNILERKSMLMYKHHRS